MIDINKKLDIKFEQQIEGLTDKEKEFFRNSKNYYMKIYEFLKPLMIAVAMFWLFNRIKNTIGFYDAIYVVAVAQLVFLRMILSKLS